MKLLKNKALCLVAATSLMSSIPVFAAGSFRPLEAYYNNIRVSVNDEYKSLTYEPFIVDGVTYVGVRDIGELFNIGANWNIATQTVELTGGLSSTNELMYTTEIAALEQVVADLTAKLQQYETSTAPGYSQSTPSTMPSWGQPTTTPSWGQPTTTPSWGQPTITPSWGQTTTTPNYPNYGNNSSSSGGFKEIDSKALDKVLEDFEEEERIDWTFDVSVKSSYVSLEIEFDGDDFLEDFNDLSTSKVEGFIEDVCDAIAEELVGTLAERHSIKGSITDADNNDELVSFEYDDGDLELEEIEAFPDLKGMTDYLEDMFSDDYDDVVVLEYTDDGGKEQETKIDIDGISLDVDRNDVLEFIIELDFSNSDKDNWNSRYDDLKGDIGGDFDDLFEDVMKELEKEYNIDHKDDEIIGYIESNGDEIGVFDDKGIEWSKF